MDMNGYGFAYFFCRWIWMDMDFTKIIHVNLHTYLQTLQVGSEIERDNEQ